MSRSRSRAYKYYTTPMDTHGPCRSRDTANEASATIRLSASAHGFNFGKHDAPRLVSPAADVHSSHCRNGVVKYA